MRSKEEAHDYRYFPDPDLLPLELDAGLGRRASRASLPELPDAKKARFVADYGLHRVRRRRPDRRGARAPTIFEAVAAGRDGKQAANWVINELFGRLNKRGARDRGQPGLRRRQLGGLHRPRSATATISGKIAKDVFEIVWTEGGDPAAIVEARGLRQVTDTGAIEAAVDEVDRRQPGQGRSRRRRSRRWPAGSSAR